MPIKLPKGFARRKSAGNVLEEGDAPSHSSFRVIERPSSERKSFSDGNALSKRMSEGQLLRTPTEDQENIFAGQDHLHPRNFGSSTRRSTDGPSAADSPHSRSLYDIPIPPLSGALRAAGRTFSFGGRFSKASTPTQLSTPVPPRDRAMTNSTSSTATPPRLLETDLQVGPMGDDFNTMLGDFSKRDKSRESSSRVAMTDGQSPYSSGNPASGPRKDDRGPRPSPIDTSRSKEVEPSPYSWDSKHSEEGLLATSYSPHDVSSADRPGFTHSPSYGERRKSLPLATAMPSTTSHRALDKPQATVDRGLRRSVMYPSKRDAEQVEDDDAKLIMQSLYNRRNSAAPLAFDHDGSDPENDTPLFSNGRVAANDHAERRTSHSGEAPNSSGAAENHPDHSIAANALLAVQYEKTQPGPGSSSTKVMTPSQFEHYRQQKELRRSNSDASKSENSEDSELDEEDEVEKSREVERQRRRQEAHLSVYRQQMMKVTGQQSPAPPLRPELDRASNSAPNLATPTLDPASKSGSGKSSEGDDDEEIPLGILAAHGFPNKNRPPSRLAPSSSIPNMRASYHHQPYLSSPGGVEQDPSNRFSLPVFARNLPQDPYYGAGLVKPPNRESLAFGGGSSVHGGPTAAVGPSPGLPPGGLVGVIATEERARAMRRGSPNMQAMHEYQAGMPAAAAHPGGVPRPYTMMNMTPPNLAGPPPAISATEQAQIQLSQQMSSMMQMQMQWMQQMIQMQGGQGAAQPPMSSGGLSVPPGFNPAMPSSMPSPGPFHDASPGYPANQRTLSMLDPNVSSRLNSSPMPYNPMAHRPHTPAGQGYAPSIAPSERSNVGLAPRYRPVSTMQADPGTSADASLPRQWNDENHKSFLSDASPAASRLAPRPISSGGRSAASVQGNRVRQEDDEDEDEGWAEMMKKREKKRNNWKLKKETSGFGDLLNAVH